MKNITIHRVPQYMSKNVNVICVDGIPVCTARGNKTTSNIVAKLSKRIEELEKAIKKENEK